MFFADGGLRTCRDRECVGVLSTASATITTPRRHGAVGDPIAIQVPDVTTTEAEGAEGAERQRQ
jgi:hypothetical protein